MKKLTDIYKQSFFGKRHKMAWRVPIICNAIASVIDFESVIDVGCAIGDIVQGFNNIGKDCIGLEGSESARPFLMVPENKVVFRDLREKFTGQKNKLDLCLCLEVMEHIEPEYADNLVYNLHTLSDKLLLSIAPPGQGGHYHVNCQEIEYWDEKFKKYGYERKDSVADKIRYFWNPYKNKPGIKAYYFNLHYYELKR